MFIHLSSCIKGLSQRQEVGGHTSPASCCSSLVQDRKGGPQVKMVGPSTSMFSGQLSGSSVIERLPSVGVGSWRKRREVQGRRERACVRQCNDLRSILSSTAVTSFPFVFFLGFKVKHHKHSFYFAKPAILHSSLKDSKFLWLCCRMQASSSNPCCFWGGGAAAAWRPL